MSYKMKESARREVKEIVIARFETLNQDSKILLMGQDGPMTVRELLKAIKEDSELGKKIVEVQFAYIKMLASGEI